PEEAPAPNAGLFEVHMDPNTGENERYSGGIPDAMPAAQRASLPITALPDGWDRTSRNAACPCGSGRKFKHCHGSLI
ncbi:MAG: SEC-C domain-containing protein, partial [Caulobacteraceae bacterium]|nr:SEC-C domain-containing protein [Caulobacteraceae bacterium]